MSRFLAAVMVVAPTILAGASACIGDEPGATSTPDAESETGSTSEAGSVDGGADGGADASTMKGRWLVIAGGHTGNPNLPLSLDAVMVAPINVDGTIGAWKSQTPLPKHRSRMASVAVGRSLVLIGGTTSAGTGGSPTMDVLITDVGEDGTTSAFRATTPFPVPAWQQFAATDGTSIFVVGGKIVYTATSNAGGVGTWTQTDLPDTPDFPAVTFHKGHLYVTGGSGTDKDGGASLRNVRHAVVTSGALGPWSFEPPIIDERTGHSSAAVGDTLFVFGGINGGPNSAHATVAKTTIGADGKTSTWSNVAPMPGPTSRACTATFGEYVYVIGGYPGGASDTAYDTVFVGKTFPDGTVSWKETTELPSGRSELACGVF